MRSIFFLTVLLSLWTPCNAIQSKYLPGIPNVRRGFYCLRYDSARKSPEWVAYELIGYTQGSTPRPSYFPRDPDIDTPSASNYAHSGFDLGHMCPAKTAGRYIKETFFMSNITPQVPEFNRGIWKRLEFYIRNLAIAGHDLIVITGPVYLPKEFSVRIGHEDIHVAIGFYKVLVDLTTGKTTAYLIPNSDQGDSSLDQYIVPCRRLNQ